MQTKPAKRKCKTPNAPLSKTKSMPLNNLNMKLIFKVNTFNLESCLCSWNPCQTINNNSIMTEIRTTKHNNYLIKAEDE